jgi:hypothetical protein
VGDQSAGSGFIDAVASGDIDVAIVWGPFGGYFARREKVAMDVTPVSPSVDPPALPSPTRSRWASGRGRRLQVGAGRHPGSQARGNPRILDEFGVPIVAVAKTSKE